MGFHTFDPENVERLTGAERFDAASAREFFAEAGFDPEIARERSETFRVVARR